MPARTEEQREHHREYSREKYRTDADFRDRQKRNVKRHNARKRVRFREIIAQAKAGGCALCPEATGPCLDFHHVGAGKAFSIASALKGSCSEARLVAEIAKCVVLCANCHRKLHADLVALP